MSLLKVLEIVVTLDPVFVEREPSRETHRRLEVRKSDPDGLDSNDTEGEAARGMRRKKVLHEAPEEALPLRVPTEYSVCTPPAYILGHHPASVCPKRVSTLRKHVNLISKHILSDICYPKTHSIFFPLTTVFTKKNYG